MKRPLTHVYAILIFVLVIGWNVLLLSNGRRDVPWELLGALCLIQLLGMFVAPRERRQYLLGVALLTLIAARAFYYLALVPGYELYTHVANVRATWAIVAGNAVAAGALFYLAYDFAFGEASRRYFNLPDGK